jgi:hypothetical protein
VPSRASDGVAGSHAQGSQKGARSRLPVFSLSLGDKMPSLFGEQGADFPYCPRGSGLSLTPLLAGFFLVRALEDRFAHMQIDATTESQ